MSLVHCQSCKNQGYEGEGSGYDSEKQELCDFHLTNGPFADRAQMPSWDDSGRPTAPVQPESIVRGEESDERIVIAPVNRIRPYANQPRKEAGFDDESIDALARGLLRTGQTEPGKAIRITGDPDHDYELVAGERRWRALQRANIPSMKLVVVEVKNEREQFLLSCVENTGSKDMSALDWARSIKRLHEESRMPFQAIAETLCMSYAWVRERFELLRLQPEIHALMNPNLPMSRRLVVKTAWEISKLEDPELRLELARKAVAENLSTDTVRREIRRRTGQNRYAGGSGRRRKPGDERSFVATRLRRIVIEAELLVELDREKVAELYSTSSDEEVLRHMRQVRKASRALKPFYHALKGVRDARRSEKKSRLKAVS